MSKLTLMRGLPASGKSTRAMEIMKESGNAVRVNRDLLRTMLHFDKWTGANEGITKAVARGIARELLRDNVSVIIDDTNLYEGTVQSWKDLAKEMDAKVEIENLETDYRECIERDYGRQNKVGQHVIYQMAMENGLIPPSMFVICDIDGTLADLTHRRHFVEGEKKDWKGFFENMFFDKFRHDVWGQVKAVSNSGVILVSARPEDYRQTTQAWLDKHGLSEGAQYKTLIMRRSGDKREDSEVKKDILERYFKGHEVVKVFDDRPRVIRMWKEAGLDVVDVGDGVEF